VSQKQNLINLNVRPEQFAAICSGDTYLVVLGHPKAAQLQSGSRVAIHGNGQRHEARVRAVRKYKRAEGLVATESHEHLLFEGDSTEELVADVKRKLGQLNIKRLGLIVIEIQ
jgi:ASC-1-like (ASCH) protein